MSAHNIVIEQFNIKSWDRGEKRIMVDGEPWGYIHMDRHGLHGVSYWFEQIGERGKICEHVPSERFQKNKPIIVRNRSRRYGDTTQVQPIADRLFETTLMLVARGLLKHPKIIEQANKNAAERYRKHCEEQEAKRKAADLALAKSLIERHAPSLCGVGFQQYEGAALAQALADQFNKIRSEP